VAQSRGLPAASQAAPLWPKARAIHTF